MEIQILLFASYADAFGAAQVRVALPDGVTVRELLSHVRGLAAGRVLPRAPLVAVNRCYAGPEDRIEAGDEVAIIPPVAGG